MQETSSNTVEPDTTDAALAVLGDDGAISENDGEAHSRKTGLAAELLRKGFLTLQLLADPRGYASDAEARSRSELLARAEFYLVHDINVPHTIHDTLANFTPEERKRWFGKEEGLTINDITWEKVTALLQPAEIEDAVFRVNGALAGSHINNRFSKTNRQEKDASKSGATNVTYTPRTVTVYPSKEQAIAAAKFLNILVNGSHATIIAEPIETGLAKPVWVISDDMNLYTHNAIRMFLSLLSDGYTDAERNKLQAREQEEMTKRLPKQESWYVLSGMNSYVTLHGRPGIKMYKQLPSGKPDPDDVKRVDGMAPQPVPRIIDGVPHVATVRRDGSPAVESCDPRAYEITYLLMGRDLADLFIHGNPRYLKKFALKPLEDLGHGVTDDTSVYGVVSGGVNSFLTVIMDVVHVYAAGAIGAVAGLGASGVAFVGGAVATGIINDTSSLRETLLGDTARAFIEKHTRPLRSHSFGKKRWEPRDPAVGASRLMEHGFVKHIAEAKHTLANDTLKLNTPYGDLELPDHREPILIDMSEREAARAKFATGFAQFMKDRWTMLPGHKPHNEDQKFTSARNEFVEAFADYALVLDKSARRDHHTVPMEDEMGEAAQMHQAKILGRMQKAAGRFVDIMHNGELDKLNSQTAIAMLHQTRQEMLAGLGEYLRLNKREYHTAR